MSLLLGLVPYKWWAIGAAIGGLLTALLVTRVELSVVRVHLAESISLRAQERANALQAAVAAGDQYRALESSMQRQKDEAESERVRVQANNQRVIDSLAANLRGVRDELAAYARGGDASLDTVASCRSRAEALGGVLAESLRVQDELANDAESASADARSLLQAWPVTP